MEEERAGGKGRKRGEVRCPQRREVSPLRLGPLLLRGTYGE